MDYVFQRLPNIKARKKISPEEKRRKQENEIDEIMAKIEKDIEEQQKQRQEQEKELKRTWKSTLVQLFSSAESILKRFFQRNKEDQ